MDKNQLDGLLALKLVAEKRNFTAAATALGVTPSAISQMITQLEKRTKVALLTRTTRSVTLTEAGQSFMNEVGPAIDQILNALQISQTLAEKPSGTLRLNLPQTLYASFLAPIVASFIEKYPDITLDLSLDDKASDIFESGFDAGIRNSDILAKDVTALRIVSPIHWVTVASPKYLKKHGTPAHPKDLLNHNCIRMKFGSGPAMYDQWEFTNKGKEFAVRVSGSLILNDFIQILRATVDGCGVAFGSLDDFKKQIDSGELKLVLEPFATTSDGYYLYYPKRSQILPKLRVFIDHIKEHLQRQILPPNRKL